MSDLFDLRTLTTWARSLMATEDWDSALLKIAEAEALMASMPDGTGPQGERMEIDRQAIRQMRTYCERKRVGTGGLPFGARLYSPLNRIVCLSTTYENRADSITDRQLPGEWVSGHR